MYAGASWGRHRLDHGRRQTRSMCPASTRSIEGWGGEPEMRPAVPILLVISVLGASFMGCSATSSIVSGGSPGLGSEAISPGDDTEQGSSTAPSQVEESEIATVTGDGGAKLYLVHCQSCHGGEDGTGAASGTPLHDQTGHTWHHPDAQLRDWIMNGKLPFGLMPLFKDLLSEKEVDGGPTKRPGRHLSALPGSVGQTEAGQVSVRGRGCRHQRRGCKAAPVV